jgi:putative addiction module component (TIGR02574 family)
MAGKHQSSVGRLCWERGHEVVMGQPQRKPDFDEMSAAERILHVQDLWDRVASAPERVPVTDAQRVELDRRLAAHEADPSSAVPWEQVRGRRGSSR